MCDLDRNKIDSVKEKIKSDKKLIIIVGAVLILTGLTFFIDNFQPFILSTSLKLHTWPSASVMLVGLFFIHLTPRAASADLEECEILLSKYEERKEIDDQADEICEKYLTFRRQPLVMRVIGNVKELLPKFSSGK